MVLELWFVRHGESEANINPDFTSIYLGCNYWSNLTERGKEQARRLGQYLGSEGITFEKTYSSVAIRAQESARHCLEAMGYSFPIYSVSIDLREIDQGSLEGKVKVKTKPKEMSWWTFVPEGGYENQQMVYERARRFVYDEIISNHNPANIGEDRLQRFLIFTHEHVIQCFRVGIFGMDSREAWKAGIVNTGANILRYDTSNELWSEVHKCYAPHNPL